MTQENKNSMAKYLLGKAEANINYLQVLTNILLLDENTLFFFIYSLNGIEKLQ